MVLDKRVADYIHDNQGKFVKDIIRLASQPSVSARKEGIRECSRIVESMIKEIGGTTKVIELIDADLTWKDIEKFASDSRLPVLVKGVLRAVAAERKRLAKSKPKLKRGRPSSKDKEARRRARKSKDIQQKISALFQDRFLFVTRRLKPRERKRLLAITRGLPHLRKLREIMDSIYALFDRRCRTQTALGKLQKLRHWVKRFTWIGDTLKKVFSPNLEKALIFLDDKLLPATSNAVERGNRRHRKMQKTVYRVRSKTCLEGRIALDMIRESRAEGRDQTTEALHKARRGDT